MNKMQPLLTTERLILRPLELSDATKIQRLAGDVDSGSADITDTGSDGFLSSVFFLKRPAYPFTVFTLAFFVRCSHWDLRLSVLRVF